ncbi:RNA polymerase sigma factor [Wenzhouxiangella sp. XN24]|uniref:RNA polymerase sigma factor n=1 Tax=Wenzhouxiangella sp. XN24 TaxID=2713569 RepID=UPI0013ECF823|nr:RNA polymerase sigma factor [Wenzhouxiangella sp. XN24]NGX16295.1 RNA polymerase sigma factor [Wenzhouxiangella sp. XN24]
MNQSAEMNAFLAEVEKRAFNMARFGVRDTEDALDIVQDTMLTLVRRYGRRPRAEWRPLFFRILQSRITDHHRRSAVRRKLFGWIPGGSRDAGTHEDDPVAEVMDPGVADPALLVALDGSAAAMEQAVTTLPLRQQQAFLLRTVEGLSVEETAQAMNCSSGSVKTHLSRAHTTLRTKLEDHW